MRHFRLTLLTTACAIALSACSSGGKGAEQYKSLVEASTQNAQASQNQTALSNLQASLTAAQQAESEAKSALSAAKAKVAELEKALSEAKALASANEAKVAQLQADLTTAKAQANQLTEAQQQASEAAAKVAQLQAELDKVKKALAGYQAAEAAELAAQQEAERIKAEEAAMAEKVKTLYETAVVSNGNENGVSKLSGSVATIKNGEYQVTAVPTNSQQNLNVVTLDGKELTLFSQQELLDIAGSFGWGKEKKLVGVTDITNEQGQVIGKKSGLPTSWWGDDFAHLRFGYVTENGETKMFVQGNMTPVSETEATTFSWTNHYRAGSSDPQADPYAPPYENEIVRPMLTTGEADYKGYAFYGKGAEIQQYNLTGKANFDEKSVTLAMLNEDKTTKLSMKGTIADNTFAGTHEGVVMKGAFYGTKAYNLGGLFYQTTGEEKGSQGVFGASQ